MTKKLYKSILLLSVLAIFYSCGKGFLDAKPQGALSEDQLMNTQGVEAALIGAYGIMNGNISGTWGNYSSGPSQWLFGEVAADNAHKGSNSSDQSPMSDIELHNVNPSNDNLPVMWRVYYEGVTRCNTTLRLLAAVQNGGSDKFSDERATQIAAEAKMLRGHYYFFLARLFKNVPYIDENMTTQEATQVTNDKDVFPMIEADFKAAMAGLPADYSKPLGEVGRVDKYAAESYLGKLYLYQKKYTDALPLFKDVITKKPALTGLDFNANFNIKGKNGDEGILVSQSKINADGSGDNANVGDMLAGLYGNSPGGCCGFFQPSIDLVNAFKVDANGLPFLEGTYRTNPYKSDQGLSGTELDNYQLDVTLVFDPRLDYTVGRRQVRYRDWGELVPGWIRDQAFAGPFVAVKQSINQADFSGNVANGANYLNAQNINIIRLSDVYLMAAECAVETNDLDAAKTWVNQVRTRAKALAPVLTGSGQPAAVYKIGTYPSFGSQDYARKAVRFERRLELALEGHRYYDLVRWGTAKDVLESYRTFERQYVASSQPAAFSYPDWDKGMRIPQEQIDRAQGILKQNQ
ncbi:RagB/SusD family nutrient uptake outer membrane protein [Niabella drilacis]|uniref:Starch-binding associating with outer membrane n=1 Tax=Niabella drilacis (strain DSM 25811 / CCM 8410 / CCUG 62505 / LMG 26954 / E90) TaxID=1285928 RepID=A0A1G6PZM0_NIADE|nr:RagB/SusD family nutrient uptake outer membrane protein [Niabella drilacis]SDC84837.1 Starch-binding associating with outer membrane [Niabella drilacis]